MFEDIFEFLEPVLNVFTAVVIFSLGITICVGCIMLAFKVCGRFNAFVREKAEKTINKWAGRIDNVVVCIGERTGGKTMCRWEGVSWGWVIGLEVRELGAGLWWAVEKRNVL